MFRGGGALFFLCDMNKDTTVQVLAANSRREAGLRPKVTHRGGQGWEQTGC